MDKLDISFNMEHLNYKPIEIPKQELIRQDVLSSSKTSNKDTFAQMTQIRSSKKRMDDARLQPEIKQLMSMIWQSNELHLLFADTGIGKSILAVAISVNLCKGESLMNLENETEAQTVLFYDFELSDRQFRKRYTDENGNEDPLHDNFFIDTIEFSEIINLCGGYNDKFNDILFEKIRYDIAKTNATVIVLDNLTYLNTHSSQDTKVALEVMRNLNEIKKVLDISILVLAHTPKRSEDRPLNINDLAGSKHLSNFADSISAIGKSAYDSNTRYIKQIKPSRSGELLYDADNVIVCEIEKNGTFLGFNFLEFGKEKDHLMENTNNPKIPEKMYSVAKLLSKGMAYSEIAKELNVSKGTISKWKNKYPDVFETKPSVSIVSMYEEAKKQETVETISETKQETKTTQIGLKI